MAHVYKNYKLNKWILKSYLDFSDNEIESYNIKLKCRSFKKTKGYMLSYKPPKKLSCEAH